MHDFWNLRKKYKKMYQWPILHTHGSRLRSVMFESAIWLNFKFKTTFLMREKTRIREEKWEPEESENEWMNAGMKMKGVHYEK